MPNSRSQAGLLRSSTGLTSASMNWTVLADHRNTTDVGRQSVRVSPNECVEVRVVRLCPLHLLRPDPCSVHYLKAEQPNIDVESIVEDAHVEHIRCCSWLDEHDPAEPAVRMLTGSLVEERTSEPVAVISTKEQMAVVRLVERGYVLIEPSPVTLARRLTVRRLKGTAHIRDDQRSGKGQEVQVGYVCSCLNLIEEVVHDYEPARCGRLRLTRPAETGHSWSTGSEPIGAVDGSGGRPRGVTTRYSWRSWDNMAQ